MTQEAQGRQFQGAEFREGKSPDVRSQGAKAEANSLSGRAQGGAARRGQWVEIGNTVLAGGERAPQVPEDTAGVPLEMRLRGFLIEEEAQLGDSVSIRTRIDRTVEGRLVDVAPRWRHDFGNPQAELLAIGLELRRLLGRGGEK
ncbi:2-amino-4-oxopentanoate thiolase subunit OrtA [Acididesulfobacillus acetoxydans]|nr:2-amino-4-oxopentanoate thiolase subunit OrtA [Acididesulfobacillus acetoxydans]